MRQHNLRVTGSLTINGENVISASQLSALNSTLTGQYATTGSNMYNGNQTITGSLLVTGVITANEFHTTFVTSSVLYTSGSTKFGDTNDDIMEVTGSLKVNGNITANNLSGIVSGSSQITSLLPTGVVSGSSQTIQNLPTGVVSGSSQLTASYDVRYVISGSITQTTWDNIASKPAGIISSSAQVILQSTTGQLSASRVDGLNLSQIASGSYTASIGQTFNVNTNTIITGSLSVSSLSGSGINYLAYSGGVVTAISGTAAIKYTQEFTATLGQTIFTPSVGYVSGLIDVFYNGTKLSATDYTATNGYNISLVQGADLAGDIIEIDIYNPVSGVSNNVLRRQTTFTASVAQTTFLVNYTPGLIDVFFNGSRLANEEYTANNGTSIILSEATTGGEILDVFVYSYQVGAFSGVGGSGVLNQLAYWSSQSGLTGSNSLTFDGNTLTISGSLVPAVSGAYDLGSTSKPFRHIYVGSGSIYLVNNQGQVTNTISAQSIVTTDTLNSGSISLVNSLPTGTVSGSSQIVGILTSLNTATASFTPRISNLESKSASVDISITNINSFTASNANTSLNLLTGSLATTGSNTFKGTTIMSGSTYVTGDFVVFGSSSIQYISASSVSIGTNVVNLNTNQPAVRFAGISVQDSGSAVGVTGSMLWDGCCNRWIYSNPSGVGYSGGVLMSGPRGSTLGNEPTLTCNYIAKSGGGDHLYDSCIIDDGTTTCIKNNLVAGVGNFSNCLTFGDWTTAANVLSSNKPNEQGAYIRAAVSSAEYPTYTFEDDRDTGMYRDGVNSLAFATSGSSRIQISATGDSLFNGTIVIQGACSSRICLIKSYSGSPSNPGFVITDTNGVITFNHNANGGGTAISGITCIGSNFCVAGVSYFAGNVSIGTTSNLTSGNYSSIRLGTIANWWAGNGVSSGDFYLQGNSYYNGSSLRYIRTDAATEYSQVSGVHAWSTATSGTAGCSITMVERMRISNTGLVGIGTINPDYNLVICCSGQVIANVRTNSTTAGSESGILITTPDSIGLLTVGASSGRGVNDAARCDMVMGLRTGGKIRFTTDVNANITQVSITNGITCFACQMCAPYAIFNGTAAITLPVGTTAQRTGPSTGMIRFNSSCTELEYYNGNDWLFFTSTPQSQGYYADVLVIAGGGGGGGAEASNGYGGGGAGGGAGGYAAGRIFINYTNCGYPISIGGGGTGGANNPQATGSGCNGTMGTASCALGLIAIGGGFGGGDETGTNAGNGGSGGGQGGDNTGTQGCGTLGQGCAGGYANTRNGGGGGGASTTGCHGYGGTGAGGQGRAWYNGTTYAGGGGGGNGAAVNTTTFGGAGGGGNGSATDGTSGNQVAGGTATAGTANTGGGGGGGAAGRAQGGQNGGSGIVIVRYYGSQKGFGGTITSSGGYTYHSFTSSGTYCATYY